MSRAYHDANHKPQTMDDLPVPQGDWQDEYARKNRTYNAVLFAGIAILATTISVVKSTGIIHLNFSPPKTYE